MTRLNYGDDPEFDAFIESRIDPEWTGYDTDPSGAMADREQARWERDRGCVVILPLLGLAFVALGLYGELAGRFEAWQIVMFGWLAATAIVCALFCRMDKARDELDAQAPGVRHE